MTNVIGPDVSFWQDSVETERQINFVAMKDVGEAPFVIIRAGQNLWVDPDLAYNMREAKAAELLRGTYWFYDSRAEPKAQAKKYIESLRGDLGELPLFADFEDRYGGAYSGWAYWYTFLEELKRLAPSHEIAVYTAPYYWREQTILVGIPTASLNYFKQFKLWIANYNVDKPLIPLPWTDWIFWQYTDNGDGTIYGVESLNIDLNYFNGSLEDLQKLYGGVVTTPPDTGEVMATHKASPKSTSISLPSGKKGINLRAAPAANATDIGDFTIGQVAQGTLVGTDPAHLWMDIESIDDVAVTRKTFCAAWLCDLTEIVVEPPNQPNIRVDVTLFDDWTGRVDVILNEETPPIATWTGRLKPPPSG